MPASLFIKTRIGDPEQYARYVRPPGVPVYDRQLLLDGPKRNEVLDLWGVERYGTDSDGDRDYVSIYHGILLGSAGWAPE